VVLLWFVLAVVWFGLVLLFPPLGAWEACFAISIHTKKTLFTLTEVLVHFVLEIPSLK